MTQTTVGAKKLIHNSFAKGILKVIIQYNVMFQVSLRLHWGSKYFFLLTVMLQEQPRIYTVTVPFGKHRVWSTKTFTRINHCCQDVLYKCQINSATSRKMSFEPDSIYCKQRHDAPNKPSLTVHKNILVSFVLWSTHLSYLQRAVIWNCVFKTCLLCFPESNNWTLNVHKIT